MTQEVFRTIPGFSKYEVSQLGTIRSNARKKPRILSSNSNDDGYLRHHLKNDLGVWKKITVHQAVAMTFLGFERPGTTRGLVVDHIDNNPRNNNVHNLQIVSQRENIAKRFNRDLPNNVYYIKKYNVYIVRIGDIKSGYQTKKSRITVGQYPTVQEAVEARDNYLQSIGESYKSI